MADDGRKKKANVSDTPSNPEKSNVVEKTDVPIVNVEDVDTEKSKEVKVDSEAYQLVFYMKHFRVTDISVKVVDHTLIIDACHNEHADEHGYVCRSMVRQQKLPQNIRMESLVSSFTSHGFLVIHAEWLDKKTD